MGLFDQITDLVGSAAGGGGGKGDLAEKLLGGATDLLGKEGINGLVQRFDAAGLGETVQSWIGGGDNRAVDADQVREALGEDRLAQVADEAGVDKGQAAEGLAGLLPQLVDRLTPGEGMPDLGELQELAGRFLKR